MLINVEQGTVNPSVTTLLRLSDALGIRLQSLVDLPQTKPVKVVRSGEAPALWTGEGGGRAILLAVMTPPDILELWDRGGADFARSNPQAKIDVELRYERPVGALHEVSQFNDLLVSAATATPCASPPSLSTTARTVIRSSECPALMIHASHSDETKA
jgi:hypothetical protein